MDRLRHLIVRPPAARADLSAWPARPGPPVGGLAAVVARMTLAVGLSCALLGGCERAGGGAAAGKNDGARGANGGASAGPGRIAAVHSPAVDKALAGFCDKRWPAAGADARAFGPGPASRPLGKDVDHSGRWRWINYWATWCKPCLEEMPMLGRWRDALVRERRPFALELWSVDEDLSALQERVKAGVPGPVRHIRSPDTLADYLQTLGMDRDAVLPIHMLVDPQGMLRCVRVGSVRPADWGTVRKLVTR